MWSEKKIKKYAQMDQVAFTAIILAENVGEDIATDWSSLNIKARDDNGYIEWRTDLTQFATNIEAAYTYLNVKVYNGELGEKLMDVHYDSYDFDVVPYLCEKAAERGDICLSIETIISLLKTLVDRVAINAREWHEGSIEKVNDSMYTAGIDKLGHTHFVQIHGRTQEQVGAIRHAILTAIHQLEST